MKFKWYELLLAGVTVVFIALLIGFLIGRGRGGGVVITTQKEPDSVTVSPSEPEETTRSMPVIEENVFPVDINTATAKQLTAVPGIGEVLAERIVEYRNENGAFSSVYDLTAVKGIGENNLEEMLEYITAGEALI